MRIGIGKRGDERERERENFWCIFVGGAELPKTGEKKTDRRRRRRC